MHLANELLHELDSPDLSLDERAIIRCRLAKQHEDAGEYEAASEALAELWQGVGVRPNLDDLNAETQAHVLLRVGMVTGWIGGEKQVAGAQEAAKDLISESLRMFGALGDQTRAGEARSDLARCYWREGAFNEARVFFQQALEDFDDTDVEPRAVALLRLAELERMSGRLSESLQIYKDNASLFAQVRDPFLTATFHQGFANLLNQTSAVENRKDYFDLALIEYTAASFYFEKAGHERYHACVENNLGFLLGTLGRFDDAHEHLDRAQMLMTRLKDNAHLAQVDETRARVLLAQGRNVEAEKTARSAVTILEKGDELTFLAEALITHGKALARLHRSNQARPAFEQAISIAEQSGDLESVGLAALTLVEELGDALSNEELRETLAHATALVETSEDIGIVRRLTKSAFRIMLLTPPEWKGFSLRRAVAQYESYLIKEALREAKGSVSKASHMLGFKHHQSLISLLDTRHRDLNNERSPKKRRFHHLMNHSRPKK